MVDFPNNPSDGDEFEANGVGFIYYDPPGCWASASLASTGAFLDLSDTPDGPDGYVGFAGSSVVVNETEDGLIFGDGGGGASVTTGDTFPADPGIGDLHYMTKDPVGLFVFYDDGDSQQWVTTTDSSTSGGPTTIVEADTDAGWQVWGDTLIQYGKVKTAASAPVEVYFAQPFANGDYQIATTPASSAPRTVGITATDPSFFEILSWNEDGNEAVAPNVHWIAIGEAPGDLKQPKVVSGGVGGGGGGASVTTGDTFPAEPTEGDLHYMTQADPGLYLWYTDPTSSQWVQTNGGGSTSNYVLKSGDTMTGPLVVPAGAAGGEAPQVREVVLKTGDVLTGNYTLTNDNGNILLSLEQYSNGGAIYVTAGGATATQYAIDSRAQTSSTYVSAAFIGWSINNNTYGMIGRWDGSAYYGFYTNGTGYASGGWTGSDVRLKDIIGPLGGGVLDKLGTLAAYTYTWKEDTHQRQSVGGGTQLSLLAQDVEKVFPELVTDVETADVTYDGTRAAMLNEELGSTKAIDYGKLTAVLVDAINELRAEVEALKNG